VVAGVAPYVLARVGDGVHAALRERGVAVRRADTFPGLDGSWVRIAARSPETTARLLEALDATLHETPGSTADRFVPDVPPRRATHALG
jgi:cobyrinic acid a,c-diamide synthase